MAETDDEIAAPGGIIADIAALARQLAATEPFKSASGPEALLALAARLDALLATPRHGPTATVSVAVRPARKKPAR